MPTNSAPIPSRPTLKLAAAPPLERDAVHEPAPRRAAWRQTLVDAERGFAFGFRSDSRLIVELFLTVTILVTGLVLGLAAISWVMLGLAITTWLAFELISLALRIVATGLDPEPAQRASRIAIAAATAAGGGALLAATLVLSDRLLEML